MVVIEEIFNADNDELVFGCSKECIMATKYCTSRTNVVMDGY